MQRGDAAGQIAELDPLEPGRRNQLRQFALRRKSPDALDEIGIGVAVAGDDLAEPRQELKAVEIVEGLQERCYRRGEFEAQKPPAQSSTVIESIQVVDVKELKPEVRSKIDDVVAQVKGYGCNLVEVTGGEPLAQKEALDLIKRLGDEGLEVLLETSGSIDIAPVDKRCTIIIDIKCPSSGEVAKNRWENLQLLKPDDEIKFVIADREDYDWARKVIDERDLNRWLPLVKWLLAIPHLVILFFLALAALIVVIIAWFAILFTGRYPEGLFDFVVGVMRWGNRVQGYAFVLITDRYPPFSLNP